MFPLVSATVLVAVGRRRGRSWGSSSSLGEPASDYVSTYDCDFDAWAMSWDCNGSLSMNGDPDFYWAIGYPR